MKISEWDLNEAMGGPIPAPDDDRISPMTDSFLRTEHELDKAIERIEASMTPKELAIVRERIARRMAG